MSEIKRKYQYSYTNEPWGKMPEACRELEDQGWEIVAFAPMNMDFVRIVYRKPRPPMKTKSPIHNGGTNE